MVAKKPIEPVIIDKDEDADLFLDDDPEQEKEKGKTKKKKQKKVEIGIHNIFNDDFDDLYDLDVDNMLGFESDLCFDDDYEDYC